MTHALRFEGKLIPLRGLITVGRSPQCNLVIDSERVSRRHARISRRAEGPYVEDLGSSNGVFLNGSPIAGRCLLRAGDRITIGDKLIEVVELAESSVNMGEDRPTLVGASAVGAAADDDDWDSDSFSGNKTLKGDSMGLLGGVVESMLDERDVDGAERLMTVRMRAVISELQAGASPSSEVLGAFTKLVLRLARATRKPSWLDFVLDVHDAVGRVLTLDAARQVNELASEIGPPDAGRVARYLSHAESWPLTPSDRFSLQRLESLVRAAPAKKK
jgi:pSer/pThr/pTyr-binding forkhead associated (FHA) protein